MRNWLVAVGVVGAIALAGCGEKSPDDDGPAKGVDEIELSGTYVVTGVTDGGEPHAVVKGSEIRLTFADGNLGLQAGCNSMSGDYTLDGDQLTVGQVGGTDMGCPAPLMDQDAWLIGLFDQPVTVGEDPLTLTSGDVVLTLADRESVSPDRPLLGTTWTLDGVITGESVSSVPRGPDVELMIGEDGQATVSGLCNGFGAETTIQDDEITWVAGMRTLMACEDPARQELDNQVSALLSGATAYEIEEKTLTLTRGDAGLTFQAE